MPLGVLLTCERVGPGRQSEPGPTLSVSAIVLSLSTGACWSPPSITLRGWLGGPGLASSRGLTDGCTEAGLLLDAPGGAVKMQASRSGAPV